MTTRSPLYVSSPSTWNRQNPTSVPLHNLRLSVFVTVVPHSLLKFAVAFFFCWHILRQYCFNFCEDLKCCKVRYLSLLLHYWNLFASYKLQRRLRNIFPKRIYVLSMVFLRLSGNPLPSPLPPFLHFNYVGFPLAFFLNVFGKLIMESCMPELVRMRTQKKAVTVSRIFFFMQI